MKKKRKIWLLSIFSILMLIASACGQEKNNSTSADAKESDKTIRIGYQKFGTLNILKSKGSLETHLKEVGYTVDWTEFPAGPQLLEALNVGSLDFGHTGEAPPIFAQAANAPLVYIANQPANPSGEAIVVQKDSPIKNVKDLKGKKVGLNKGSNVHYLLVRALEEAGLTLGDITPVYLPPADARAAFEGNQIDAWVIWDPFLSAAELELETKTIRDGEGLVANREFFLTTDSFAGNEEALKIIKEELIKADKWIEENPGDVAEFLSPEIGMSVEALEKTLKRKEYGLEEISNTVMDDQQKIADTFYHLKLIPSKINILDASADLKKQ
ncbi:sulfonate ABC transporter substrate-binding protein [Peribacillus simplex]|uniref:sulfonate ABC transporter substrate-binding protein n=1 Tax=Peribacillus simplex TaxID=1478 RepID=UPI000BA6CC8B|nr:sulfonate ABC transporter substrate-binding protein [Peribacillus simplex]PAK38015.1 sulfonate ABC transporter substrate-binding protein [Peribacillus simplex]